MMIRSISGFLGLPTDWHIFPSLQIKGCDWQSFTWNSLADWGQQFNAWVRSQGNLPSVLLGYSFGGRLALHALVNQPHLWKGAIIISAHPGLADPFEKAHRLEQDRIWAEKFEKEDWKMLMESWNGQNVFSQDEFVFKRSEENYSRRQLANALLHGSLGIQEDLKEKISRFDLPILWLTGSKDHRYCDAARNILFKHPLSRWMKVDDAGHRVPWVQPETCSLLIQDFLEKISFAAKS